MRYATLPLLALTATEAAAQFFVLYGRDTVVSRIDPILYPGTVSAHAHEFMGANNVNQDSDYESLLQAPCSSVGRANGSPIVEDKSAYWHPTLYVKALGTGKYIRVPTNGHQIYYINAGSGQMREPFEFPKGFRMTAGSSVLRTASQHTPTNRDNITQWICHQPLPWNQGTKGGFPTGVTSCPDYPFFNGLVHFPHCWNGNDFDPSNPSAHVSYPTGDVVNGPCPSTHPIKLPHILFENNFDLSSIVGQFEIDSFVLSNGDPTGYGWHADFYNGWKENVLHNLLNGTSSCSSHDVGDCLGVTFDTSLNVAQCTTNSTYPENLDGPFAALPGCNPVSATNPAQVCKVCPAGVVGGTCVSGSNGVSSGFKTTTTTKAGSTPTTTSSAASGTSDDDGWDCED